MIAVVLIGPCYSNVNPLSWYKEIELENQLVFFTNILNYSQALVMFKLHLIRYKLLETQSVIIPTRTWAYRNSNSSRNSRNASRKKNKYYWKKKIFNHFHETIYELFFKDRLDYIYSSKNNYIINLLWFFKANLQDIFSYCYFFNTKYHLY